MVKQIINEEINKENKKTLEELSKAGYTPKDIKNFIESLHRQKNYTSEPLELGKNKIRIGVSGDYHMGNINYDTSLMDFYAQETKRLKVDLHLNTGDLFDGWYQNRPASIFEQNAIGFDRQIDKATKELSKLEAPIYFITGNHSYNTFVRGAGIEAGPYLEDKLKSKGLEAHYLGNGEGNLILENKVKIRLLHPDGGTCYAVSYRPQKIIESLESGQKPQALFIGHFHKMDYMFYRNIHQFQTGTFCGQTKFMKGKGIPAHKGFWIIDIYAKSDGEIRPLIARMYPAYK